MVVIIDNRRKLPGTASRRGSGVGGNNSTSSRKRKNDEKSKYWETADGRTIWKDININNNNNTNNNDNNNDEKMNLDFDVTNDKQNEQQVSRPIEESLLSTVSDDQQQIVTDCDMKMAATRINNTVEGECNQSLASTSTKKLQQQDFSSNSYQTPVSSKLNSSTVCSTTGTSTVIDNSDNFGLIQRMEQQIEFLQEQLKHRDSEIQQYHTNQNVVSLSKRILNTNVKTTTTGTISCSPRRSTGRSILLDNDDSKIAAATSTPKHITRAATTPKAVVATTTTTTTTRTTIAKVTSTPKKSKKITNVTKIRSPPPPDMLPRRTDNDTLLLSSQTSMVVDVDCAYDDVIIDNTISMSNDAKNSIDTINTCDTVMTANENSKELIVSTTLVDDSAIDMIPLKDTTLIVTDTKMYNNHQLKEKNNEIEKLNQIIINLEETNQRQTKTIIQIQEQLITNDDKHIRQVQKSIETYQNEVLRRDIEIQQYKKDTTNYDIQLNEQLQKVQIQYEYKMKQLQDQHQNDIESKCNELQTIQLELTNAKELSVSLSSQIQQHAAELVDKDIIIKDYAVKIDDGNIQMTKHRRTSQDKIDKLTEALSNEQRKRSDELQTSKKHISELQELIRTIQHEQQQKQKNDSTHHQQHQHEQSHAVGNTTSTGTITTSSIVKKSVEYVSLQNELFKVRSAHGTCIDRIDQLERRIERRDHTIQKLKLISPCDSSSSRINNTSNNKNNIINHNNSTTTPHYQRLSGSRTMNNNNNSTVQAVPTIGNNTMNGPVDSCSRNANTNRNLTNNNNNTINSNNTMNKKRKHGRESSFGQSSRGGVILRNTPPVIIPFPTSFPHPTTAVTTTGTTTTTHTATARTVAATTATKPTTASLSFTSDT